MEQKDAQNLITLEEFLNDLEKIIGNFKVYVNEINKRIDKLDERINKLNERINENTSISRHSKEDLSTMFKNIENENKANSSEIINLCNKLHNEFKPIAEKLNKREKKITTKPKNLNKNEKEDKKA